MLKFVFFDYDGTLLDSLQITYESFRRAFSELGYGELSLEFFRREFSMNHKKMYVKMGVEERDVERVERVWWEHWEGMRRQIKLFPETVPTLKTLCSLGVGVGLVSDGRGARIKEDLERFGIKGYFSVVVVREDVEERKPSPKSLLVALEKVGREAGECIYVGDRVEDVQAGRAAGMKTGCVCNGTHKLEWLLKEEPDFIFSDVSGVVEIFDY